MKLLSEISGKDIVFSFGFEPGIESLVGRRAVAAAVGRRSPVAEVVAAPGMPSYRNETSMCTALCSNILAGVSDVLGRFICLLQGWVRSPKI